MADLVDTRTVGKLENYDGRTENWVDWSFRARAWFAMLSVGGRPGDRTAAVMEDAERMDVAIDREALPREAEETGRVIYNVLAQVCHGRALAIIKQPMKGHGLECWRRLCREYEPDSSARFTSMLGGILEPRWEGLQLLQFVDALHVFWEHSLVIVW